MATNSKVTKRKVMACAGAFSACLVMSAAAQQVTGDIVGTVTDATGAVVPAAQVTVVNTGTSQVRTVAVSANGEYTVSELQPGSYTVKVVASGFKAFAIQKIVVAAGTACVRMRRCKLAEKIR